METLQIVLVLLVIWLVSIGAVNNLSNKLKSSLITAFHGQDDQRHRLQQHTSTKAPLPNSLTHYTTVKSLLQRYEANPLDHSFPFAPTDKLPAFYGCSMYII